MRNLHMRQQRILDYLLEHPQGATADEIAKILTVTKTAAKDHIGQLEYAGYLSFEDSKGGVGRPKRKYLLTDQGLEVFPRQYSWLSNVLMEQLVEDLQPQEVAQLLKGIAYKIADSMGPQLDQLNEQDKLLLIVKTMNDLGYRAKLTASNPNQDVIIEAINCVYHTVAKSHPQLCQFDISFLEASTKKTVKLESCIARGGTTCRFCISSKKQ